MLNIKRQRSKSFVCRNAAAIAFVMNETAIEKNWRLVDFDFVLPPERIAVEPVYPRDQAKLLHVTPDGLTDKHVSDLAELLQPGDLLVVNDTKVIPARLYGLRGSVKVEVLLHKKLTSQNWLAFARPGKRLRVEDQIIFAPDFSGKILEKGDNGEILLQFDAADASFFSLLQKHGHVPLPPYIKRPDGDTVADREQYQTIYADREGAVAAPTAGLHFTPDLFQKLEAKGIERCMVTLHVGAGTFLPVKADYIKDHHMHAEWGEITAGVATKINTAKEAGRRIVSVGTTSLRLLETAANNEGRIKPFAGETNIFIYPGYKFKIVDALMTNFHLPKSTLYMLVSAFAGIEVMQKAYLHAIKNEYRFYSYGDASLLEKAA